MLPTQPRVWLPYSDQRQNRARPSPPNAERRDETTVPHAARSHQYLSPDSSRLHRSPPEIDTAASGREKPPRWDPSLLRKTGASRPGMGETLGLTCRRVNHTIV